MNILMLASDFYPVWGGTGAYINNIAGNFPKEHSLHIVTPKRVSFGKEDLKNNLFRNELPENVHIHYLGEARDTFNYNLSFQLNCRKHVGPLVQEHKIDVIHSQSSLPDLFISAKKIEVPIITTIHSTIEGQINALKSFGYNLSQLDFSEKMLVILGFLIKIMENRYYNSHRHYITVSNWSKRQVIKEKGIEANRIKVIHNGIDTSRFEFPEKSRLPESTLSESTFPESKFPELNDVDSPIILFLSRMIQSKGINYLAESMPEILSKCDAHFVFAGPGPEPVVKVAPENYTFLGYVPYENTPALHHISDIFILPSLYENFPINLLEAMISESGVISTDVGGIPEMITNGENGILIPFKDSTSIADSVIKLIENNELKKELAKNAKETVEKEFNMKSKIKDTVSYYEEVLKK